MQGLICGKELWDKLKLFIDNKMLMSACGSSESMTAAKVHEFLCENIKLYVASKGGLAGLL